MALSKRQFVQYLKDADFRTLFIEEMGWNKYNASLADIPTMYVGEEAFNIKTIAHRNGFQVLLCNVKELPSNSTCKKLDTKLRKAANDYICIFVIPGTEHHQWVAPVKTNEKRDIVIIEYAEAEKAQFLYEKIAGLSFDIDEVTTIVDVKERIQGAFSVNSEKITKDFYTGFSKEHKSFAGFITGIDDQIATKDNKNKQWYTSVMLNRLMFCYFIQKKGFLNGDENYLRNKLRWVQEKKGNNQFFKSFYKGFLVQLFRGGLNSPKHDDAFEDMYGRIPYLNGGMFDVHQIERDYENIDIKDEAFESLFEFFDKWRWHLDTRVTASGRDINPDVLGYIFEQYINDRAQMGAYYTKEDITEYIGRNTIIPYLFDAVAKKYPEAFEHDGAFWQFIRKSGDDFIYDAVKKGSDQPIPEEIAKGIDTEAPDLIERRKSWNNPTPASIGLPTEIWRETIERLQRYEEVKSKIASGEVKSVNDFITYNLNTPKIAYDFLNKTDDKKFIERFYAELLRVTILDPTCGSGAFLFAALNLLEPLYEVCISRMEEFNQQDHSSFSEQLSEIQNKYRSNIQYFIYKSIILRNLYGVDIMAEAVEIAKLRLFLKMVAVVEVDKRADNLGLDPLPDVDFNIRCGNTLVGYATEKQLSEDLSTAKDFLQQLANQDLKDKLQEQLSDVADTYEIFRLEQLSRDADVEALKQAKTELNAKLACLNALLNKHLHSATTQIEYESWCETHQPFHWLAEFYQILHERGGFDIIIGNPPYVVYTKKDPKTGKSVSDRYKLFNYKTISCNNLYAFVLERIQSVMSPTSKVGMIIPISCVSNDKFVPLLDIMLSEMKMWYSSFSNRPGKLFENVEQRLTIAVGGRCANPNAEYFSSRYQHWNVIERPYLFKKLYFVLNRRTIPSLSLFKVGVNIENSIYNKLTINQSTLGSIIGHGNDVAYYHNGPTYFVRSMSFKPNSSDGMQESSHYKKLICTDSSIVSCILNSSVFYWYYKNISNCRDFSEREILAFPINNNGLPDFKELNNELKDSYIKERAVKSRVYGSGLVYYEEYYPSKSKSIIDKIDIVLGRIFGFTQEETDYVINYDIKYRMGEELIDKE